ncbi:MAG: hypothetical protein ABGZ17_04565, partial [Planctomycetaceae bacterium]
GGCSRLDNLYMLLAKWNADRLPKPPCRLDEMMQNGATTIDRNPFIKTTQIIVVAMSFGVFGFLLLALMMSGDRQDRPLDTLGIIAVVAAPVSLFVGRWGVSLSLKRVRRQFLFTDVGAAASDTEAVQETVTFGKALQTSTVIMCGALEGAALLNLVFLMVGGHIANLAAAAALLFTIGLHFPTLSRAESWIANQRRLLDEQRQTETL